MGPESPSPYPQVPANCVILSLETLPPGDRQYILLLPNENYEHFTIEQNCPQGIIIKIPYLQKDLANPAKPNRMESTIQ